MQQSFACAEKLLDEEAVDVKQMPAERVSILPEIEPEMQPNNGSSSSDEEVPGDFDDFMMAELPVQK